MSFYKPRIADSYGDYFIAVKDHANAIVQFKKALALKENTGSRKKLEELEGGGRF